MTHTTHPAIHPFHIDIPESDLADLKRRLAHARWPEAAPAADWSRGVPRDYLESLTRYFVSEFDWRRQEARLNQIPQFTTEIDGQRIHFLHLRSENPNAFPLLLLHGWPGSFVEMQRLLEPLTRPEAHGGSASDAFDVIVPSLPGFGFSVPVREAGWATGRTARALAELMRRLGYSRYGVHGGDVGAGVAGAISAAAPESVTGVHVSSDPQGAVAFAMFTGDPTEAPSLSAEERETVARLKSASEKGSGYLKLQSTRPQTFAYALSDSPVGQLAWIVEKFQEWTDRKHALPEQAVDRDQLLANICLYWFTRSGASAAHFIYECMNAREWGGDGTAPTGFAVFGSDPVARKLMDPEQRIAHWSDFSEGGHFPAMEVPELLTKDIRAFFRTLR
jgi:pimeloyl-ACP methyl ester carboxylesterase